MYNRLVAYKKKHNLTQVPRRSKDRSLGNWVYIQRRTYNNGDLSKKRIQRFAIYQFCVISGFGLHKQQQKMIQ
jgi:hypothetical protein